MCHFGIGIPQTVWRVYLPGALHSGAGQAVERVPFIREMRNQSEINTFTLGHRRLLVE